MLWIIELLLIAIVIYYFIKWERPKKRFLVYGIIFSIISFILRIPFKLFLNWIENNVQVDGTLVVSSFIILMITIIITEITRYLSLNRYLTTRSYKNGVLFGMGWAIFDLIVFLQTIVLAYIAPYVNFLSIDLLEKSEIIAPILNIDLFSFMFLVIISLAQTTLIVMSVIKKKKRYVYYSIIYGFLAFLPLKDLPYAFIDSVSRYLFISLILIGLFIIFNYKKIR